MKSEQYVIAAAVISFVWSMRSEAHDSWQTISQVDNLTQLAVASFPPLREMSPLIALGVAGLVAVCWLFSRHQAKRRSQTTQVAPPALKLVAVRDDTSLRR